MERPHATDPTLALTSHPHGEAAPGARLALTAEPAPIDYSGFSPDRLQEIVDESAASADAARAEREALPAQHQEREAALQSERADAATTAMDRASARDRVEQQGRDLDEDQAAYAEAYAGVLEEKGFKATALAHQAGRFAQIDRQAERAAYREAHKETYERLVAEGRLSHDEIAQAAREAAEEARQGLRDYIAEMQRHATRVPSAPQPAHGGEMPIAGGRPAHVTGSPRLDTPARGTVYGRGAVDPTTGIPATGAGSVEPVTGQPAMRAGRLDPRPTPFTPDPSKARGYNEGKDVRGKDRGFDALDDDHRRQDTIYGVPKKFRDMVVPAMDESIKRESRRGRVASSIFRNRRGKADAAATELETSQKKANGEYAKWLKMQGYDDDEINERVRAFSLSTALKTASATGEERTKTLVRRIPGVTPALNWWERHDSTYNPFKGKEFWNARNLKNNTLKSLALLPVAVLGGIGGAALGAGVIGGFVAAAGTRGMTRALASANVNGAARAGTIARDRASAANAATIAAFENNGAVIRTGVRGLRGSTEGLVKNNRKRMGIAGIAGFTAAVLGAYAGEAIQSWFGGGGSATQAEWKPGAEKPATGTQPEVGKVPKVEHNPTPKIEAQPIGIDESLAGENTYIWGAYEDLYGAPQATPTIMERVAVLRANGWDVEITKNPNGTFAIPEITAPKGQYLVFPDGRVEELNGETFMGTKGKVGALEKALDYGKAKVFSAEDVAKMRAAGNLPGIGAEAATTTSPSGASAADAASSKAARALENLYEEANRPGATASGLQSNPTYWTALDEASRQAATLNGNPAYAAQYAEIQRAIEEAAKLEENS